ncbi:MAG TPA: NotI family restriction endonuclease [Verrucomicrobiae bacterium]|nr:NotI family restriction endonuclease [Verrucomicrobiae bacterium]
MAKPKKPRIPARYSIGEWYGAGFETLSPRERFSRADAEYELDALTGTPCPFQVDAECSKKGGVCSLRLYQQIGDGPVTGVGPVITTCPLRFLESETIFRWVAEKLLQTTEPVVLSQIGFLDRLRPEQRQEEDDPETRDFIGTFFSSLVGLEREKHLSNAEIAWFVVGYESTLTGWKLAPRDLAFTRLDASVKSLTGGVPLSKEEFEEQLRFKLGSLAPGHPLGSGSD